MDVQIKPEVAIMLGRIISNVPLCDIARYSDIIGINESASAQEAVRNLRKKIIDSENIAKLLAGVLIDASMQAVQLIDRNERISRLVKEADELGFVVLTKKQGD